jgi:hypothetical protein
VSRQTRNRQKPPDDFLYDAFISYSHKDGDWVRSTLLPRLEGAGLRVCIDTRDFEIGAPSLVNMENAVERSRKTLLVLTPAWLASEWTDFEALLVQARDPAGRARRILPLLLKPCPLPGRLKIFTYLDLTKPVELDAQMRRLVAAIRSASSQSAFAGATSAIPAETRQTKITDAPNPFRDRGRINEPGRFFDRQQLVREIEQLLVNGSSVSLVGPSEIGKSSLLYYLYRTWAEWLPDTPVEYFDLQRVLDEEDFCETVLGRLGQPGRTLRDLKHALERERVVLLFDEVERLAAPEFHPRLHDLLRSLAQEPTMRMVVSTQRPLVEVFPPRGQTSPFHNIFHPKQIGPLTPAEVRAFLEHRLAGTGIGFTAEEMDDLITRTGGHPARLQEAAYHLFAEKER